jgi:hypothetical protein
MYSLTDHFIKFLSNIQPDGDRAELAQEIPDKLRDYLKDTNKIKTVHPHTRLSGSYSRYTAIKKIKDVDVLLFVSEEYKDGEECIRKVINDLIKALVGFPEYLKDKTGKVYADLALKRQRRSVQVHITFGAQEFDIDVVPSIIEEGIEKPLLVPDRDLSKWVFSDPVGYGRYLSQLNKEQSGKIVPLVKMFKHWRDIQMKRRRPKSYWLECIVSKHTNVGNLDVKNSSWGELFLSLLTAIYNDFCDNYKNSQNVPLIKDPMLGNNVAKTWTRDEFEAFMRQIEASKRLAESAIKEEDEYKAIKLWQELFNDDDEIEHFPSVVEESWTKPLSGNSLFVSASGQVLANPSKIEKSWQSPAHRNYGDSFE